ncbi:hypothetical protein NECAME_02975 [Necator americanus]|uniref:Uncharacterized protein n=1 Tax=Necator americanus TaxID=51031 RepID=W2T9X9_NECAM|nr:hypothetical protein NECAME_02975 [Necator americanus]ETN78016.1 hypothetical protein NECAME_02975 [Necator americanus]
MFVVQESTRLAPVLEFQNEREGETNFEEGGGGLGFIGRTRRTERALKGKNAAAGLRGLRTVYDLVKGL